MTKMTTEEAFVKVLQTHGIENAFGIIGSAFMPISDLFPKAGITFWDVAHETNGGLIADGYTRSTGKIAMCIAQNGLMKKYQPEGGYETIKPDMDVLKGVEVIKIVPESLRGKYKIGQNMDMKSRIDLARQILERNSHTAKETLDVMGFEIIDNEPKLVDDAPW